MKVLIVDDEAQARRRLASLVEEIGRHEESRLEIVGEAPDGMAALELVRRKAPDVILLDIAMPEVDGLDVVRHLPEPRPLIIFQTAYHEYALAGVRTTGPRLRGQAGQEGTPVPGARTRARMRLATLERAGLWHGARSRRWDRHSASTHATRRGCSFAKVRGTGCSRCAR